MIPANLRLMLSLRFSGKNAGVAQKTSENKPDPRTGHAREGVRHPKHRLAACRAVLFASLVDDPDSDPVYRKADGTVDEDRAGVKRAELFNLIEEARPLGQLEQPPGDQRSPRTRLPGAWHRGRSNWRIPERHDHLRPR